MKVRNLIPLMVAGLVGCEPEPRDISTLTLLEDGVRNGWFVREGDTLTLYQGTFVSPEDREPYSGPVFFTGGPDSQTVSSVLGDPNNSYSGNLKDGLFHGGFERDHENGQLEVRISFSNGTLDGPFEGYHSNGQLSIKGSLSNGGFHGPFEMYHENGQLMGESSYSNGELDGPFEMYLGNGQLMGRGSYSNGERCGEWVELGQTRTLPPCPSN